MSAVPVSPPGHEELTDPSPSGEVLLALEAAVASPADAVTVPSYAEFDHRADNVMRRAAPGERTFGGMPYEPNFSRCVCAFV